MVAALSFGFRRFLLHLQLLRVAGCIDPAIQAWISGLSRVPDVLRALP